MKQARLDRIDSELSRIGRRNREKPASWLVYGDSPKPPEGFDGLVILLPKDFPRPEAA